MAFTVHSSIINAESGTVSKLFKGTKLSDKFHRGHLSKSTLSLLSIATAPTIIPDGGQNLAALWRYERRRGSLQA